MTQINPYNPLDLEALGASLIREMERRPVEPLAAISRFNGSGIYALYYVGDLFPYAEMGEFNRATHCRLPIYIGRAREPGARRGRHKREEQPAATPFDPVTRPLLFDRIREHRNSIKAVERGGVAHATLMLDHFRVRALVSMPLWVPLAEAMAIRSDRPVWNDALSGFGIHDPGSGRDEQRRSQWDTLHAGRAFATRRPPNGQSAEALASVAHAASVAAVRRALVRLELSADLVPSLSPAPSTL